MTMTPPLNSQHTFPANKFYPPRLDDSQLLLREALLTNTLPRNCRQKKILVVEAQAGQGKTTLIYQYLTYYDYFYGWYQIGEEDSDPILFLTALYQNIKRIILDFASPELEQGFGEGSIEILNSQQCVNILLNKIDSSCKKDIYLVFDDLHLIDKARETLTLLDYIIKTAPPKVHFILASRRPLKLKNTYLRDYRYTLKLQTSDLSLSDTEIQGLYQKVFNQSLTTADIRKIQNRTAGWIMGIVLMGLETDQGGPEGRRTVSFTLANPPNQQSEITEFFKNEIFALIPEELHNPLMQLSLLNEVPIQLAEKIIGINHLGQKLLDLAKTNFFIYLLDTEGKTFRFHHFFQEYLQHAASEQLSGNETQAVFSAAAAYYLKEKNIYEALTCYFKAEEFKEMDTLLREEGLQLLAQNLNITIMSLLNKIPESILHQHGCLCLFAGILGESSSPRKTIFPLTRAREIFISREEEIGELLALAQSVYYHFVISSLHKEGATLLPRMEELFQKHEETLTPLVKIMASRNLAAGFCFFTSRMDQARHYAEMARDLATTENLVNFIVSSRFILGYIALFSGNRRKCLEEIETLYPLLPDPVIGMQNKLSILFMHLDYLATFGDHDNLSNQLQIFLANVDERLIRQTVAGAYIFIYQCHMLIAAGETEQALARINEGLSIFDKALGIGMSSQLLQWRAYTHSLLGHMDIAEADLQTSSKLREISGGHFHTAFHDIIKGATHIQLEKYQEAERGLSRAVSMAEEIPSPYLISCGLMHRAFLRIQRHKTLEAYGDLARGLKLMREHDYTHFWGWTPSFLQILLTTAVTNNIERGFARKLAHTRLDIHIENGGQVIPQLHFTLLDHLSIRLGHRSPITAQQISPQQRELLYLLLTNRHMQQDQSVITGTFWADITPKNSRVLFDNLNKRLRKTLNHLLTLPAKEYYLTLKNEILCLKNSTTDGEQFMSNANEGLRFYRDKKYWQAGNCFFRALSLWKGHLPGSSCPTDTAVSYGLQIELKLIDITLAMGDILSQQGLWQDAIELLEAQAQLFPVDIDLNQFLYQLSRQNNRPIEAHKVLERLRIAMQRNNFQEEEISECINEIVSAYEPQGH